MKGLYLAAYKAETIELLYITKEEIEREINIRHERAKKKK